MRGGAWLWLAQWSGLLWQEKWQGATAPNVEGRVRNEFAVLDPQQERDAAFAGDLGKTV
jgi:hypothetical protein